MYKWSNRSLEFGFAILVIIGLFSFLGGTAFLQLISILLGMAEYTMALIVLLFDRQEKLEKIVIAAIEKTKRNRRTTK